MRSLTRLAPLMLLAVTFLPGGEPLGDPQQATRPRVFMPGGVPPQTIPAHPAGLVCVVHASWCAMLVPGDAGAPCSCPTLYGRTTGVLR